MLQYDFLKTTGPVALYGLSRTRNGYAREVLSALRATSPTAEIFAVHPSARNANLHGVPSVRSAQDIEEPELAVIMLKPGETRRALLDAAGAGAKKAWLVTNAGHGEIQKYADTLGMQVVGGYPLDFTDEPALPFRIHRALTKLLWKV